MHASFIQELLAAVADRGRLFRDLTRRNGEAERDLPALADALLSGRGEASGMVLAAEILSQYRRMSPNEKAEFFALLAGRFAPDPANIRAAFEAYDRDPDAVTLKRLTAAVEAPRQEFIRRLNLAPGATLDLVRMREDLLERIGDDPELAAVDDDFVHLFTSWFNRGFLVLRKIDWTTPANILEKIIRYEAVHEINGWDDLRRRLEPPDRRCFAFFHPTLADEPLIFVEVALTAGIVGTARSLLAPDRTRVEPRAATAAVFYSISNCQRGLGGVSFGSFLIKQVVEELSRELPNLKTFATLSPVPTFMYWLRSELADRGSPILTPETRAALTALSGRGWHASPERAAMLDPVLSSLTAAYLLNVKTVKGRPRDPVARFHLGNGARLERINVRADLSANGLSQSAGVMVNYLYDRKSIEVNHEAYANDGVITAASSVRKLARGIPIPSLPVPA